LKNSGERVANLNSVPSPIRPARVLKPDLSKTAKKMANIRGKIARIYKPSNNMSRPVVVARQSPPKKIKPILSNAVARMKASAVKLKANMVSTKRA
jgi:hypothetical protein